jgi:putative oxidoreductase
MKILSHLAALLFGLAFLTFGSMFLLNLAPAQPAPPEGSAPALFMGALVPTGYLKFVKICQVIGGLLVILPATRRVGLLVLGPILVNILAYHAFIMKGEGLLSPITVGLSVLALFLLWTERSLFKRSA